MIYRLLVILIFAPFVVFANWQGELKAIDQQLQLLEKKLEQAREEALNKEVQAQPFMFDKWEEFAEDIRASENKEKEVLSIKEQIQSLKKRKQELLREHAPADAPQPITP